jgi:hypothetical protein
MKIPVEGQRLGWSLLPPEKFKNACSQPLKQFRGDVRSLVAMQGAAEVPMFKA